jgi:hypothetical protein
MKRLHGQKGRVIAPVMAAFAETSPGTDVISDLVASALAAEV